MGGPGQHRRPGPYWPGHIPGWGPIPGTAVVLSPLVWGIWQAAYNTLAAHSGTNEISWDELHEAAVAEGWEDLGGDPGLGPFKLVVPHPKRDPAGLTAMVNAAGEYFDKPSVKTTDLEDPQFLEWLEELFDTASFTAFSVEDMLLFGRSAGDAGMMVESFLLDNMEGLQAGEPFEVVYPDPIAWFDFPFAIYMGKETSAEEKEAALDFKSYLLTADQQAAALEFGLRLHVSNVPRAD